MSGLCGFVSTIAESGIENTGRKMALEMSHESGYSIENYCDMDGNISLSRVSLKVFNRENQPIYNEDRSRLIMMEGEIFDSRISFQDLESKGHKFRYSNDPELILHLFEEYGINGFAGLNGWFVAVIYEKESNRLIVVNDRWGFKPLYYYSSKSHFIFASEIKAILKNPNIEIDIDINSVSEHFHYSCQLNERTKFKNVFRLPPASCWVYEGGQISKNSYWKPSLNKHDEKFDLKDILESGNELFCTILGRYLNDTDNICVSLTGGLDTRTIFAAIDHDQYSLKSMHTRKTKYSADSYIAKIISDRTNKNHLTIDYVDEKYSLFSRFPEYAEQAIYLSDGNSSIANSHNIIINDIIKKTSRIFLSGIYGTQIVGFKGGYLSKRFVEEPLYDHVCFDRDFYNTVRTFPLEAIKLARLESETLLDDSLKAQNLYFIIKEECRRLWGGVLSLGNCVGENRTPFTDNDLIDFLFRHVTTFSGDAKDIQEYIINSNNPGLAKIPTDKGHLLSAPNLVNAILSKLLIANYWFGIICNSSRIPAALRIEKMFFSNPYHHYFNVWMKDRLSSYVKDILYDERTFSRPFYNREGLIQMVESHFKRKKIITLLL